MPLSLRRSATRVCSTILASSALLLIAAPSALTSTRLVPRSAPAPVAPAAAAPFRADGVPQTSAAVAAPDTKAALDAARAALGEALGRMSSSPTSSEKASVGGAIDAYVDAVNARQEYLVARLDAVGTYLKANNIVPGQSAPDPASAEYVELQQEFSALDVEVKAYRPGDFYTLHADRVEGPELALASNCDQNFDGVTPPALPAGWTSVLAIGTMGDLPWQTTGTNPDTVPNSAFAADPNHTTDIRLDSPTLSVGTGPASVTFQRRQNTESSFDGMVLEISINGGAFQDILAAGGSFPVGGYNGTCAGGPLSGRQFWTGLSGGFVTATANIPASAASQTIVLRWRTASDGSVGAPGTQVDSIVFSGMACVPSVACGERFDLVTPPTLPAGWTATSASGPLWTTSSSISDTSPNAASTGPYVNNEDTRLDSRPFAVVSPAATVTFRRNISAEPSFDGVVLEISIGGGPFQDILAAGGSFAVGPYNSTSAGGPLAGRMMWSGISGTFQTTTANLPASANGQNIVLRWRFGADGSVITGTTGQQIDTISTTGTACTGCAVVAPSNVTVSNDANQCGATVSYPPATTFGNCGPPTCTPASGSFFPKGTTTVTCSAVDNAGNTSSATFTVTVNDTQPPTIACPANITTGNTPNVCGANVNFTATASDNCPGLSLACTPASGSLFPIGTTVVTCTATDASANTATCQFTVTVNDTQPPTITCPANITTAANTMQGMTIGAIVNYPAPTASDNCPGGLTVSCVPASGSFFPTGTTTVTCTATDPSGNSASCTFTITVTTAFTNCYVDDATGDTLSLVANPTSPLYRLWQYHVAATNTTFQGYAEYISNVPGRALSAYDHDSPTVRMDLSVLYSSQTATATVVNLTTGTRYTLRDRNILNDPPCQ